MSKGIDWNSIRAEYIGGGISQRKLAAKYGVSPDSLMRRANRENWKQDRDKAISKGVAKLQQRTANAIAGNAEIAAEVKRRLLLRLQRIEEKYPFDATEVRTKANGNTVIFRIRDLTAAYRDLTDDMPKNEDGGTLARLDEMLAEVWNNAAHS